MRPISSGRPCAASQLGSFWQPEHNPPGGEGRAGDPERAPIIHKAFEDLRDRLFSKQQILER